jgi:capsular polysaccharide transport system permease protein
MRPNQTYAGGAYAGWRPGAGRGLWAGLRARRVRLGLRVVLVLLPTLLCGLYYGLIATDRYVSEARFVIRTASKPANALGGLSALLQLVGMSRSQDDAYAVHDFLTSRDALAQLGARLDLPRIYGVSDADFLARYPSFIYGPTQEDLYLYFQHMLTVIVNGSTGLTTLRVEAFRPADAQSVARILLELGEGLVNRLNLRIQEDAVRVSAAEVARAEERRVAAQVAMTAFRNRELTLDPTKSSAIVVELIGHLSAQLADTQMQIAQTQANSHNSPQLAVLQQREAAIARQIATERGRVASDSDGLADKIASYEKLALEQEFSIRVLAQAVGALEAAKVDARRQQLFLERVVEPGLPDQAMEPRRWRSVLTVFGFNIVGLGVLWLVGTGLREHAAAARR